MTELHVTTCTRCGAPLNGRDCSYCGAHLTAVPSVTAAVRDVLREDRNRNGIPDVLEVQHPPSPPPVVHPTDRERQQRIGTWVVGGIAACTVLMLVPFAIMTARTPRVVLPPAPVVSPPVVSPTVEPATSVTAVPTIAPNAPPPAHASTVLGAPRLTNEQWGKRVVANVSGKLKFCVEQDLLHTPGVPTSYTATVTVGRNELVDKVVFLTKPTYGFEVCGSGAIIRGFADTKIHPASSLTEPLTFVTNISFPDAKPATVADHATGGWP